MLILNVQSLLEQRHKSRYWLHKQLGMSYQNVARMVDNKTKSIQFEKMEQLCTLFQCTPNDLFRFTEEK